jgi:hypothetical protein
MNIFHSSVMVAQEQHIAHHVLLDIFIQIRVSSVECFKISNLLQSQGIGSSLKA